MKKRFFLKLISMATLGLVAAPAIPEVRKYITECPFGELVGVRMQSKSALLTFPEWEIIERLPGQFNWDGQIVSNNWMNKYKAVPIVDGVLRKDLKPAMLCLQPKRDKCSVAELAPMNSSDNDLKFYRV